MNIIGREFELSQLEELYQQKGSNLVAIYGRRRIGKSFLIEYWIRNKDFFLVEGLENQNSKIQIQNFKNILLPKIKLESLSSYSLLRWNGVLDLLTLYIKQATSSKKKFVIVFDEFQWMCANRDHLVALLKMYWDQHWKNENVMLILCGSIASFMVNKVIKSKALYGRIHLELQIKAFHLNNIDKMIRPSRSLSEALSYSFVFGGVPKYLASINPKISFEKNINKLCFTTSGIMRQEFEKIFYQQFKSARIYIQIVRLLQKGAKTFNEISLALKIRSGGSLKRYIENLKDAEFISSYHPFQKGPSSKFTKYFLSDEFSRFYLTFIEKNKIALSLNQNEYLFDKITSKNWLQWQGISFENFCFKHALVIAKIGRFNDDLRNMGKFFPDANYPVQLDLVFERFSNIISVFEIKYMEKVGLEVIREFETKIKCLENHPAFKEKTIEKGLIVRGDVSPAVYEMKYFHFIISVKDILKQF